MRRYITIVESLDPAFRDVDDRLLDRLSNRGYIMEPLYHGSDRAFDAFDMQKMRTRHIYTSPDYQTARFYGDHVHLCVSRAGRIADITGDGDHKLIRRLCAEYKDEFYDAVRGDEELHRVREAILDELEAEARENDDDEFDRDLASDEVEQDPRYLRTRDNAAIQHAEQVFTSGNLYDFDHRGRFQEGVLGTLFDWGYDCVKFFDYSSTGQPISYVFNDPDDLFIVAKIDARTRRY